MGVTADIRTALKQLEVGRTALIDGNAGTIRTQMHKLYGAGSYVVRADKSGMSRVTLLIGASNAVRADLGVKVEASVSRTAAEMMADLAARRRANNG